MSRWFIEGGDWMPLVAVLGGIAWALAIGALVTRRSTTGAFAVLSALLAMFVACLAYVDALAMTRSHVEAHARMMARGMEEASHLVVLGAALGVPATILAVVGLVRASRASGRATAREP